MLRANGARQPPRERCPRKKLAARSTRRARRPSEKGWSLGVTAHGIVHRTRSEEVMCIEPPVAVRRPCGATRRDGRYSNESSGSRISARSAQKQNGSVTGVVCADFEGLLRERSRGRAHCATKVSIGAPVPAEPPEEAISEGAHPSRTRANPRLRPSGERRPGRNFSSKAGACLRGRRSRRRGGS